MYHDLSITEVRTEQGKWTKRQVTLQSDTVHPNEKNDILSYLRNIFYILYNFFHKYINSFAFDILKVF